MQNIGEYKAKEKREYGLKIYNYLTEVQLLLEDFRKLFVQTKLNPSAIGLTSQRNHAERSISEIKKIRDIFFQISIGNRPASNTLDKTEKLEERNRQLIRNNWVLTERIEKYEKRIYYYLNKKKAS